MVNKPLNEDVSGTNGIDKVFDFQPNPRPVWPPSHEQQTLSCFGKGRNGD